ncbi:MAG: hypothetical protein AB8G95_26400 [Anaerolineae bacterium]
MSSEKEDKGRKTAKQIAELSANLLQGIKTVADHAGADTTALDDKLSEIQSTASQIDEVEPPKKLDWIVFAGFAVFMVAMIGAVFGQNIRWLGAAFVIMPIVMLFGLFNNVKNMQPDWDKQGEDVEIYVPNAPQSVQKATGSASHKPHSKLRYWFVIIMVGLGALFFGAGGLFLLFSEYAADNF